MVILLFDELLFSFELAVASGTHLDSQPPSTDACCGKVTDGLLGTVCPPVAGGLPFVTGPGFELSPLTLVALFLAQLARIIADKSNGPTHFHCVMATPLIDVS